MLKKVKFILKGIDFLRLIVKGGELLTCGISKYKKEISFAFGVKGGEINNKTSPKHKV
jgi:hypothetical protein